MKKPLTATDTGLPAYFQCIIPSVLLPRHKPEPREKRPMLVIQSPVRRQFFNMEFTEFVGRQAVSLWKDDKRNQRLSRAFRSLVSALLAGNFKTALSARKVIAKCCCPFHGRTWNLVRLALVEADFFREAMGMPALMEEWDEGMAAFFGKRSQRRALAFFATSESHVARNKALSGVYGAFGKFRGRQIDYLSLPVLNCAVCATMGAGKSTFVNALLGRDVLPSRCEATTAKITSVYDRDGETRIMGFVETASGENGESLKDVSLDQLNVWNDDKGVRRIFLQGDFDGIDNNGFVTAIHDTPGTNNSLDPTHHKTTIDFLTSNRMDLVVFVLNAGHLRTTDERSLLEEVFAKVVKKHRAGVLFVLNKVDTLDPEKESLEEMLSHTKDYLKTIGFKTPEVLPSCSKAARLLKMRRDGRERDMTPMEKRELSSFLTECDASEEHGDPLERTGLPEIEHRIETILK